MNETITPAPIQPTSSPSKLPFILTVLFLILSAGAGGVYLGKYLYVPKTPVPIAEPTATPTLPAEASAKEGADPTANWKTLTDKKTFSLKYPNNWEEPTESLQSTHYEYVIPAKLSVRIGFTYDQNREKPRTYEEETILARKYIDSERSITVDGIQTKMYIGKVLNGGVKNAEVLLNSKSGIINIGFSIYGLEDEKLFDQILSTFRFTN